MFTFNGKGIPGWWGDTAESLLNEKLNGIPKEFPGEARVSMNHGIKDEEGIGEKLGEDLGAVFESDHGLYVNGKWPGLAASIDGFMYRPDGDIPDIPLYMQDKEQRDKLYHDLLFMLEPDTAVLCEVKKSTSTKWQTEVPIYYRTQLQAQMHILDIEAAIIVAETVAWLKPEGEQRKRPFWDLKPHLVMRDPNFVDDLDDMNDRWLLALRKHGELSAGGDR